MQAALAALREADFARALTLPGVWRDVVPNVAALNGDLVTDIVDTLIARCDPAADNPPGRIILGGAGAGKTHLLASVRRQVWERGGWFVLLSPKRERGFWETAAEGFVQALEQPMPDGASQAMMLFVRLRKRFEQPKAPSRIERFLEGIGLPSRAHRRVEAGDVPWAKLKKDFIEALAHEDPAGAGQHHDVARAFLALLAGDADHQHLARHWLGGGEIDQAGKAALGVLPSQIPALQAVEGLSALMALGGPTLCAIDQIDDLIGVSNLEAGEGAEPDRRAAFARAEIDGFAGGAMALRDVTRRCMTVLSTLDTTWAILEARALRPFEGRFHPPLLLPAIRSAEVARQLVETRLAAAYNRRGFTPPYPSWPFAPTAFENARLFTPRRLLEACELHRAACLRRGKVWEMGAFEQAQPMPPPSPEILPPVVPPLKPSLDDLYAERQRTADVAAMFDGKDNGEAITDLLTAAMEALVRQTAVGNSQSHLSMAKPTPRGLDAQLLVRIPGSAQGTAYHGFCVLLPDAARMVQTRLLQAIIAAGIDGASAAHHLAVLRRRPFPRGERTTEVISGLFGRGGRVLAPDDDDLRRFAALRALLEEAPGDVDAWLRQRRPLAESPFFSALGLTDGTPGHQDEEPPSLPVVETPVESPVPTPIGPAAEPPAPTPDAPQTPPSVGLPMPAPAASLAPGTPPPGPTHATSLPLGIRADNRYPVHLRLDRLSRHVAVIAGDGSSRTVLLRRLIEEAALAGVPSIVIDSTNNMVGLLDPWPKLPGEFSDEDAGKAATFFARTEVVVWTPGRTDGNPLDLAPLTATRLPSRLLERNGTAHDPGVLLGDAGGRVRVSVVSLSGLPAGKARQDFVTQLLTALLRHIQRQAVDDRHVSGLFLMDDAQDFVPTNRATPSRSATAALMRQEGNHRFGMVFSTSVPQEIDPTIIAGCATHFFGLTNSPAALASAREMLNSRGGVGQDPGRLPPREFYLTTEGIGQPLKPLRLQTPLCLTHVPANPPSEEDVIACAARTRVRTEQRTGPAFHSSDARSGLRPPAEDLMAMSAPPGG